MSKKILYSICIILAGLFWGVMGLFVRALSVYGFDSLQITALRLTSAVIMFILFALIYDRKLFRINPRDLILFLIMGLFGVLAMSWLYFSAIVRIDLSVASILLNTAPIWVLTASVLFYGEKLNIQKIVSLLLAVVGCVFVSGFSSGSMSIAGLLCGFASGLTYAFYSIIGKYALNKYPPITVTLYSFIVAGIGSLFICGFSEMANIVVTNLDFSLVLKIAGIGFVSVFVPFLLYNIGLSKVPAGKASIMASVEPMMATISGMLAFGEFPGLSGFVGIFMIISAIVLLNLDNNKNI